MLTKGLKYGECVGCGVLILILFSGFHEIWLPFMIPGFVDAFNMIVTYIKLAS